MDKLKIVLEAVKKYQFWVLCGVILLTSLTCWWLATAGAANLYKQQTSKIESDFNSIQQIGENPPNQGVVDKVKQQHDLLKQGVFSAWETLYTEQKEKNPFPTKVLGEDFQRQFENLKPQGELDSRFRERYQTFLSKEYLPKLQTMIDVRRPVEDPDAKKDVAAGAAGVRPNVAAGMPGMGGAAGAELEWTGIVDWEQTDYENLLDRFYWRETPSTLEVVVAQEDLWVYEALLRVIQRVNEGATTQANAPIKRIDALEIASRAAQSWSAAANALFPAGQMTAPGGMGMGMPGGEGGGMMPPGGAMMPPGGAMMPPGGAMMPPGGEMGEPGGGMAAPAAAGGASSADQQLFAFRYVDDKGQPLPSDPEYPFAKHPYAEFKMMPIRMSLVMDQRRLPKLLVECANSNMPIEVRNLRILKSQGETLDLGAGGGGRGGMGGGMGGMPGMPGGMGMPKGGMPAAPRAPGMGVPGGNMGAAGAPVSETGQYDVPVDIHAVIYIYNPPDRDKLGTGAASAQAQAPTGDAAAPSEPGEPGTPAPAGAP